MGSQVLQAYRQGEQDRQTLEETAMKQQQFQQTTDLNKMRLEEIEINRSNALADRKRDEQDRVINRQKSRRQELESWISTVDTANDELFESEKTSRWQAFEQHIAADYPDGVVPPEGQEVLKAMWDAFDKDTVDAIKKVQQGNKTGDMIWLTSADGAQEVQVPMNSSIWDRLILEKWKPGKATEKKGGTTSKQTADVIDRITKQIDKFQEEKPGTVINPATIKSMNTQLKEIGKQISSTPLSGTDGGVVYSIVEAKMEAPKIETPVELAPTAPESKVLTKEIARELRKEAGSIEAAKELAKERGYTF